jgi:hypothetical protein
MGKRDGRKSTIFIGKAGNHNESHGMTGLWERIKRAKTEGEVNGLLSNLETMKGISAKTRKRCLQAADTRRKEILGLEGLKASGIGMEPGFLE